MNLLVINGPNMNFLGIREPQIYGSVGLEQINARIDEEARKLGHTMAFFQSNCEGAIIDAFQKAYHDGVDGIILNPAPIPIPVMPSMTPFNRYPSPRWRCTCPISTPGRSFGAAR